jgi:hypothetical protein
VDASLGDFAHDSGDSISGRAGNKIVSWRQRDLVLDDEQADWLPEDEAVQLRFEFETELRD